MSAFPRTIVVGGFLVLGLAACSGKSTVWDNEQGTRQNTVVLERQSHDVLFARGMSTLGATEQAKLDRFLATTRPGAQDVIAFDLPDGSALTAARADAIRKHLGQYAVRVVTTPATTGQAPVDYIIRVVVERAVVRTPDCPDWSRNAWPNYENAPTSNMGCTTETALGQMIANPRDLVAPEAYEPADAEAATRAIDALQKGKVKWPEKELSTSK